MNREQIQYFLAKLMEEAAEVIHAAAKAHRFGLNHDEPGYGSGTNKNQITEELGDLLATASLLGINLDDVMNMQRRKLKKIELVERTYKKQRKSANTSGGLE